MMPKEIAGVVAHFPSCTCGHNVVNHHMLDVPTPGRSGWTTVTFDGVKPPPRIHP